MTTVVDIKSFTSTTDSEVTHSKTHSSAVMLYLRTGNLCYSYLYCARPVPIDQTVHDAYIEITTQKAMTGSKTITLRAITESWSVSKETWDNRPTVTSTGQVQVTKTSPGANTVWRFDVTDLLQEVSNGGLWQGFRFQIDDQTTLQYIYGPKGTASHRPVLHVEYSQAPDAPEHLSPSHGNAVSLAKPTLRFDFVDEGGNTTLAACQVRINSTIDTSTPDWDSGEQSVLIPQLDLAATDFPGLADAQVVFWDVRVKDGSGLWSDWSEVASFYRAIKGTVTLINPAASPDNIVNDSSPNFAWSTDFTQDKYQLILTRAVSSGLIKDTGVISGTDNEREIELGAILSDSFTVEVRAWDTIPREATPGDPTYSSVTRTFTFVFDGTVDPVTNLHVVPADNKPWAHVTWNMAELPDKLMFVRGNKIILNSDTPSDYFVSGTSYEWYDRTPEPRTLHDYRVVPVINNRSTNDNLIQSVLIRPLAAWLCSEDGEIAIPFLNKVVDLKLGEDSESQNVLGSSESISIYQGLRGYEGTFSGVISGVAGELTPSEYLEILMSLREDYGRRMILSYDNKAIPCVVQKINAASKVYTEEIVQIASFEVYQRSS